METKTTGVSLHCAPVIYCSYPCENKMQLCIKAAEKLSAAFLHIFKKAAEKLRIFLDLRKTCVFYKIAAENLYEMYRPEIWRYFVNYPGVKDVTFK